MFEIRLRQRGRGGKPGKILGRFGSYTTAKAALPDAQKLADDKYFKGQITIEKKGKGTTSSRRRNSTAATRKIKKRTAKRNPAPKTIKKTRVVGGRRFSYKSKHRTRAAAKKKVTAWKKKAADNFAFETKIADWWVVYGRGSAKKKARKNPSRRKVNPAGKTRTLKRAKKRFSARSAWADIGKKERLTTKSVIRKCHTATHWCYEVPAKKRRRNNSTLVTRRSEFVTPTADNDRVIAEYRRLRR